MLGNYPPHFALQTLNTRNARVIFPLRSFSGGKIGGQDLPMLSLCLIRGAGIYPPSPLQPDPASGVAGIPGRNGGCSADEASSLKCGSFNNASHRLGCCASFDTFRVGL